MKYYLYLIYLSIILFYPNEIKSQSFKAGVLFGGVLSQVDGDNKITDSIIQTTNSSQGFHKVGFTSGLFVNYPVSKKSVLQLELKYFQKGSKKKADIVNNDYISYLLRLNYIEVPLYYKYNINKFKLNAGIAIAYLINYNYKIESNNILIINNPNIEFRRFEKNIQFEIAYQIRKKIDFGLNVSYSMLPINKINKINFFNYYDTNGLFNMLLNINLKYEI